MLNKFAIVPEHFILITRTFKPQTYLLEAEDLAATYACIRAYHEYEVDGEREELFAFFNSGEHSGASQRHRHLQLLPVARMRDGLPDAARGGGEEKKWSVLADRLVGDDETAGDRAKELVPFATFAERIHSDMEAGDLRAVYLRLYRKACLAAARAGEEPIDVEPAGANSTEAQISYNLAMTRNTMVLCPRTAEGDVVRNREGREVGRLALNGTVLAGTALVKSQEEWDALGGDGNQLWEVLGKIGVPPSDK